MAVTITHTQTPAVIGGASPYQITDTVTAATNISTSVFVYRVDTSAYDHVASVQDMNLYPTTRAQAVTDGKEFYRQTSLISAFASIATATSFALELRSSLQLLANNYSIYLADFAAGTVTETLTSAT